MTQSPSCAVAVLCQHSNMLRRNLLTRHWSRAHGKRHFAIHPTAASSVVALFSSASAHDRQCSRPFDKILIANRGEIACRVIRTCQRLGVATCAIYSSADGPQSLHASMADEAYSVGTGPSAAESYLLQEEILRVAQSAGAQAIHPGYGFLSENAKFCQRVQDTTSMAFVGPGPRAIQAMGSKSESKEIMELAGVPTTPGYHGSNQDPDYLLHEAVTNVGFPLLIKAVMGGGGKGMRLVWKEKDFLAALESCQRESQSAFGDASVLLERYLVHPRHVEVQIVADTHGNIVHLNERDCSLQRRHQKIIEEAPASDLPMDLRDRLGEMGKRAAQAVGYVNAGTVEFLLDTQETDKFYFCEMNTRLQVEHPISELITGIDLVEWQLRIAAGEELPIKEQSDIPCVGHAFEARIYAENPARDFLPATGLCWYHRPPAPENTGLSKEGVRVDTGIQIGQEIGVYYDPMISKLVVHGDDRAAALDLLVSSLKRYQIAGVPTNIDFLVKCADHPTFRQAGAVNTGFLDTHADDVKVGDATVKPSAMARVLGAFASLLYLEKRVGIQNLVAERRRSQSPWSSLSGSWRMGGKAGRLRRVLSFANTNDGTVECLSNADGSFDIGIPTGESDELEWFHGDGVLDADLRLKVVINGSRRKTLTTAIKDDGKDGTISVHMWPSIPSDAYAMEVKVDHPLLPSSHHSDEGASASHGKIHAPMPGKLVRVNASVGDSVKEGDILMVMEAMKMEHTIRSPRDGVLLFVHFDIGDVVEDGVCLAVVDEVPVEVA